MLINLKCFLFVLVYQHWLNAERRKQNETEQQQQKTTQLRTFNYIHNYIVHR